MKKATILAALLLALMLIVSCGGGTGGNPADDLNGGPDPLAGKTFKKTELLWDLTLAFDNNGNITKTETERFEEHPVPVYTYYHYTIDTAKKLLSIKKIDQGVEKPRTRIYAYDIYGGTLELTDAIPGDKTFAQIASDYWFPTFESGESGYELSIHNAVLDKYDEGEMRFEYLNPAFETLYCCSYEITDFTDSTITGTKCIPQTHVDNYESYPAEISISYSTSGSGENMKVFASISAGISGDTNTYELTWNPGYPDNWNQVQN